MHTLLATKAPEGVYAELTEKGTESENRLVPSGWAQLETVADRAEASVTLEVNGCRIIATAKTDLELLAKVCRALSQYDAVRRETRISLLRAHRHEKSPLMG